MLQIEESIWTSDASDMGNSIILFLTKRLELMKQIMVLNYGQVSISSKLGGFQIMNICSNIGVGILRMWELNIDNLRSLFVRVSYNMLGKHLAQKDKPLD